MTNAPRSANSPATKLLPEPIPPAIPMMGLPWNIRVAYSTSASYSPCHPERTREGSAGWTSQPDASEYLSMTLLPRPALESRRDQTHSRHRAAEARGDRNTAANPAFLSGLAELNITWIIGRRG